MPIHDYDIANGTGAIVRADINDVLDAIVENNSNLTIPSPTFAYMWWADTTTDILKLRNSSNTAFADVLTITTGVPIGGGSGTVTSVGSGAGLTGGPITDSGTLAVNIIGEVDTVITAADEIMFADITDTGNIKKDTIQGILDLVPPSGLVNIVEDITPQLGGVLDTNLSAIDESEGDFITAISTSDIWSIKGNTLLINGTGTINSFGTATRSGAWRKIHFNNVVTIVDSANLMLPGGANITTADGDFAFVFADNVTQFRVLYYRADGTAVVGGGGITLGTPIITTSGTSKVFTDIPAGTKRITINFNTVSANITDDFLLTIGDSGGIETSGYASTSTASNSMAISGDTVTNGFNVGPRIGNSDALRGSLQLNLENSSSNTWVSTHSIGFLSSRATYGGGVKSLSGELTQLKLQWSGTNTFNGGEVNISFE